MHICLFMNFDGAKKGEIEELPSKYTRESFTSMDKISIITPEGRSSFKHQPFKCHLPMVFLRIFFMPSNARTLSNYFFVRIRTLFMVCVIM